MCLIFLRFQRINLSFKLQRAAHVNIISSALCKRLIGSTDFRILNVFIRLIARST